MTPSPQEGKTHFDVPKSNGERVVISGMSGLYPKARNVKDFSELLYNKVDPITTENRRWDFKHPDLADHIGMVPDLTRFDSQFFKLSHRNGYTMDVMSKKLLEQAYQAIYDAGLSPRHLCGKNIGVYIGSCFSETEKVCFYSDSNVSSGLIGCSKTMFANRISYWLDVKGPSYSVDQSCCSSIAVLEAAFHAIERVECEAAIVGAGSLCMHPQTMIHFGRLITLSPSGKTKSFDENADGCVKSEAINVLFLQKAKDALRIYADVIHVKSTFTEIVKDENGPKYGFYRDAGMMASYLKQFYKEANVSPNSVEYVDAFGAGTSEIDKAELDAFEEVFCSNRNDPLVVGSVMSNIGYTEAASGIASITKVLIGYQKGKIAANLNCDNPRQDIPALKDNRMAIATDHHPIQRSYAAINNLSYNGVNAHVLLHGHFKPKTLDLYKSTLPRLVTISGRHENAVKRVLDDLKCRPIDPEELALLHNIHETRINGHLGRGYAIYDTNSDGQTISIDQKVEHFDDVERPIWFVYSGMGSQWNQMGSHLMRIPVFAAAIKRCHDVLKPKGVDLIHIITTEDKSNFNNILHAFVGITAIQIGLTDVVREIGIVPDNIIGHSLGEVACAYADGSFTAEQAILVSHARGQVSIDTPVIRGCMAAVGLGYQQIKDMCPSDIFVGCHNGPDSCTLSGPEESMKNFLANLTAQGIFAKEVPTGNIAYHSKYIKNMSGPHLKILREIIKNPIARSERWISTSIPEERWHEDIAKYSSPDYHNNNMTNPVLFEESLKLVPTNAVLIEIAPHGLLQAILKRSLSSDCRHIPLIRRGHSDNIVHLLNAFGSLFMEGYNPQVRKLYPKIEFPVSTETPSLSHLIDWTHDDQWHLPLYIAGEKRASSATKHLVTLHDEEFQYLRGNVVRGRVVYPFAAALVATWDTLAMSLGLEKKKLSVYFRDVHLFAQPILHEQRQLRLNVVIHRGTGKFEVSDDCSKVATGYIIENTKDTLLPKIQFESTELLDLESKDVYELLQERDYSYREEFCTIHKANTSLTEAQLLWTDNWITLIDGILQLNALQVNHSTVCQPTYIRRIGIDVNEHINKISTAEDKKVVTANISHVHDFTKCGGIVLENIKFHKLPPLVQDSVTMKTIQFMPHFQSRVTNMDSALEVCIEILNENVNKDEFNVVGIITDTDENIFNAFKNVIKHVDLKINYCNIPVNKIKESKQILCNADLVLIKNLSTHFNLDVYKLLLDSMSLEAFILNCNSRIHEESSSVPSSLCRIVTSINTGEALLDLIKLGSATKNLATVVHVNSQSDLSQLNLKIKNFPLHKGLTVFATTPVVPGLKEHVNKWRREFKNSKIAMVTYDKNMIEKENLAQIPELVFNVLKNGVWGGEYLLPLERNSPASQGVILQSTHIGNLESLKWVETPELTGSDIIVDVHYAGLNDCDAKRATGVIPFKDGHDTVYGMDFSGKTESGSSVMGLVSGGAIASKVIARRELLWDVPSNWSLQDAATVPLAYSMAFYCLKLKAEITNGMTILILGGAGALGQAVISIALAHDCKVFTTVSDPSKKKLLLKLFPQLEEANIGYSRDALFGDMVLKATKGEGCDIVITCATGELKDVSLNCSAFCGVTIDTVQLQSKEKFSFGLYHLTKQRSYMAVDFSTIFDYVEDMVRIKELVTEGIEKGYVRPLTYVTYGAKDVVAAFKFVESTRRSGRVLINICDAALEAEARFNCSPNNWQIVFCDDAVGIHFTEKLIHHGARKLLINCTSLSGYLQFKTRSWKNMGVEVDISTWDLTKSEELNSAAIYISRKENVEGIFVFVTNTTNKELEASIDKLDAISRKLCKPLKHFVVASTSPSFGKYIYSTRRQAQLPITVIHLPQFQKIDLKQFTGIISRRAVVDTILKSLYTPNLNVYVYPKEIKRPSLLQELALIAGIDIPRNTSVNATLADLGIPDSKAQTIKAYLRDSYNIYFEENVITSLTVQRIHDIEQSSAWYGFEDLKGLQIFFSHIGSEEVLASTPTVFMNTRAKYWRENEFDVNITSLCILPGLEGHHERFQLMCERLKIPAFTLQPGYLNPQISIQNMAQKYAQVLIKKMKFKENFYLLGYESGILVALEIAKILEMDNRKGTIFCIGQTPEELKNTIEDIITTMSKDGIHLENAVAKHMVNLIKEDKNAFSKIETEVFAADIWMDKLEICVEELVGHNGHTSQYIKAIINAALERIIQITSYKIEPFKLESKIVLLHSTSTFDPMIMQCFSKQPIVIHELNSSLGHIVQDLRCTSIINQHLDKDVLDLFEQNNHCETYLYNGNVFELVPCPE